MLKKFKNTLTSVLKVGWKYPQSKTYFKKTHITDIEVDPLQTEEVRVSEENNGNITPLINDSFGIGTVVQNINDGNEFTNEEVQIIGKITNSTRMDTPRLPNEFVMGICNYLGDYKTKDGRIPAMDIKRENIII